MMVMFVQLAPTAFTIKKKIQLLPRTTILVADDMVGLQQWFDSAPRPSSHYAGIAKLGMRSVIAENIARTYQGGVTFSASPLRTWPAPE
jgi:hypothetical protein